MHIRALASVFAVSMLLVGCSNQRSAVISPPAPPRAGPWGIHFSPQGLHPGKAIFYFTLIQLGESAEYNRGQRVNKAAPKTEVLFFAERAPWGPPDSAAVAQFIADGVAGQAERPNFAVVLMVPNVAGGVLQFVIKTASGDRVVINAPVRVSEDQRAAACPVLPCD